MLTSDLLGPLKNRGWLISKIFWLFIYSSVFPATFVILSWSQLHAYSQAGPRLVPARQSPQLGADWSQVWKMLQRQVWEVPAVALKALPGGRSAQTSKALSQLPSRWEELLLEPLAQKQQQNFLNTWTSMSWSVWHWGMTEGPFSLLRK